MRYILYLPEEHERIGSKGSLYRVLEPLAVYKERGAPDGKKEILSYRKHKGYCLLTFSTWKDACYFNTGLYAVKGRRFQIREWSRKSGLGAEIVIVPKEVFYGAANGGSDGQTNGSN